MFNSELQMSSERTLYSGALATFCLYATYYIVVAQLLQYERDEGGNSLSSQRAEGTLNEMKKIS
jgi:hypothetical protein